jgi:hypothetical protein
MTFIFDENLPFEKRCEAVLGHQLENHSLYRTFANTFGIRAEEISGYSPDDIPLLPIRAFKQAALYAASGSPEIVFRSSGTGDMERSRHLVADPSLYRLAIDKGFFRHFSFDQYAVFCYTPGYADNPESSLIWMLQHLVDSDPSGLSRFLTLGKKMTQNTFSTTVRQDKKFSCSELLSAFLI